MIHFSHKVFTQRVLLFLLLATLLAPAAVHADPPSPSTGIATVDGDAVEWDLTADFFANMHGQGKVEKPIQSKLYLRYECATETLFALILPVEGYVVAVEPYLSYIKLGTDNTLVNGASGDDGNAPDFQWIAATGNVTDGWEASAILPPGFYNNLNIQTRVFDDKGQPHTSAVINRAIELNVSCTPTAVTLSDMALSDSTPYAIAALVGAALVGALAVKSRRN